MTETITTMPAVTYTTSSGWDLPRISVLEPSSCMAQGWSLRKQVLDASTRLGSTSDTNGMVSIPRSSQSFDIPYGSSEGSRASYDSSLSTGTPTSPGSWEESLQALSKNLQVICCSPDRYETFMPPQSPISPGNASLSSGPRSPVALTHASAHASASSPRSSPIPASPTDALAREMKLLQVRHVQSEQRLREKLTSICRSPRSLRTMVSDPVGHSHSLAQSYPSHPPSKLAAVASVKRKSLVPSFRTTIDIGKHGVEDLQVFIEDHKLSVSTKAGCTNDEEEEEEENDLPALVDIPANVDVSKLICVVRDGVLEVKEGKNRSPGKGCFLHGLDLRRSLSVGGHNLHQKAQKQTNPIVIEDEGSHKLKLILQVPTGYKFSDLKIKTVDDLLIVSGKRDDSNSDSTDAKRGSTGSANVEVDNTESEKTENTESENTTEDISDSAFDISSESIESETDSTSKRFAANADRELFHVFELPSSVDPYSMTAHLSENNKLIIQAVLSNRDRSNTM